MKLSLIWLAISVAILSNLLMPQNGNANVTKSRLDLGIKAFEQGDYKRALVTFEKAQYNGNTSNALYYNLGATYYKLGYYRKAQRTFQLLVANSKMEQIAYYNLGLVALKQGDADRARRRFKKSLDIGDDEKISQLSAKALKRLGVDLSSDINSSRKLSGYIETSYGLDDRVFNKDLDTVIESYVGFIGVSGYVDWTPLGTQVNGLRLSTDVDLNQFTQKAPTEDDKREYPEATNSYSLSANYLRKVSKWYNELGIEFDSSYLGESAFQNSFEFNLHSRRYFSHRSKLSLQYQNTRYASLNPNYDHLQGTRQRISSDFQWKWYKKYIRISYSLEFNNRADSLVSDSVGTYFKYKDYSPTRHQLKFKYYQPLTRYWSAIAELHYRVSLYANAYELAEDQKAVGVDPDEILRRDNQYRAQFSLSYLLSKNIKLEGKYSYLINESTIHNQSEEMPDYSYNWSLYQLGMTWFF